MPRLALAVGSSAPALGGLALRLGVYAAPLGGLALAFRGVVLASECLALRWVDEILPGKTDTWHRNGTYHQDRH